MATIFTHNGTWTVTSAKTGEHRTFRVHTQKDDAKFAPGSRVVSVLSGPDNTSNYTPFGFVGRHGISVFSKRRGGSLERCARMLERLEQHEAAGNVAVESATTCRRCSRPLTTPQSIAAGIGPICEGKEIG